MFDVAPCPFSRRKFHFYRRVFRRHPEGIEAHRIEDIVALLPEEPCQEVTDGIVAEVPHVQGSARIREHLQTVEFFFAVVGLDFKNF